MKLPNCPRRLAATKDTLHLYRQIIGPVSPVTSLGVPAGSACAGAARAEVARQNRQNGAR
jgi:hypothetical protein